MFLVGGFDFLVLVEFGMSIDVWLGFVEKTARLDEVCLGLVWLVVVVE